MSSEYQSWGGQRSGMNSGRRPTLVFTRSKPFPANTQECEAVVNLKPGSDAETVKSLNQRARRISNDTQYAWGTDSDESEYLENGDVYPSNSGREYPQRFYPNNNSQNQRRSSRNTTSTTVDVTRNRIRASEPSLLSTAGNETNGRSDLTKDVAGIAVERKCDSEPNVWKERAEFFNDAVPRDLAEEEKMLNEALMMSCERFKEEELFRSLQSKLDSPEIINEPAPPAETLVTTAASSFISHSTEFPALLGNAGKFEIPALPASATSGATDNISNIIPAKLIVTSDIGSIESDISVEIPVLAEVQLNTNAGGTVEEEISTLRSNDRLAVLSPDGVTTRLHALRIESDSSSLSRLALNERVLTCDQAEEYLHRNSDQHHHQTPTSPHEVDWQRGFDLSSFSSVDSGFLSDAPRVPVIIDTASAIESVQMIEARAEVYSENQDDDRETEVSDVTLNENTEMEIAVQQFNENEDNDQLRCVEVTSEFRYFPTDQAAGGSDWTEEETIVEEPLEAGCCARCECGRTIVHSEEPNIQVQQDGVVEPTYPAQYVNMAPCRTMPYMGAGSGYPYAYGYPGGMVPAQYMMAPGMRMMPQGMGMMPQGMSMMPQGMSMMPQGMGVLPQGMAMMAPGMGVMAPGMEMLSPGLGMMSPGLGMMTPGMGMMPSGMMMPGIMPYGDMMPYARYPMMQAPGMMMQPVMMVMPSEPQSRLSEIHSSNTEN